MGVPLRVHTKMVAHGSGGDKFELECAVVDSPEFYLFSAAAQHHGARADSAQASRILRRH